MSFRSTLLKTALAAGTTLALAGVAQAQSTEAGTSVSNTFTLDYTVGTTQQPRITNDPDEVTTPSGGYTGPTPVQQGVPTDFTVDRVIDLLLTAINPTTADTVLVAPGATAQTLAFTLTNEGNDNQSFSFNIADLAVGTSAEFLSTFTGGLDIRFQRAQVDLNNDGDFTDTCEAAQDVRVKTVTLGTTDSPGTNLVCDLPPAGTATVTVIGDIPLLRTDGTTNVEDGDEDRLILVAEARNPTVFVQEGAVAPSDIGDLPTNDTDGNTIDGLAETVFADGNGSVTGDTDSDGRYGEDAKWVIIDPDLTAAKTVGVLEENSSLAACNALGDTTAFDANAYSTPGACVEYRITVTNSGEQATSNATGITIVDDLPDDVIYVETILEGFDGTAPTVTTSNGSGSCTGVASEDCVVTVSNATLNATVGTTTNVAVVKIRALIE